MIDQNIQAIIWGQGGDCRNRWKTRSRLIVPGRSVSQATEAFKVELSAEFSTEADYYTENWRYRVDRRGSYYEDADK